MCTGGAGQICTPSVDSNGSYYFKLVQPPSDNSVGRAPDCCAGGQGFNPQTGPTLGV